jgi:hypothetical protein
VWWVKMTPVIRVGRRLAARCRGLSLPPARFPRRGGGRRGKVGEQGKKVLRAVSHVEGRTQDPGVS